MNNIEYNFKQLEINFQEKQKRYLNDVEFIKQSISQDSEFGRLSLYLFTTKRNSKSIVNRGYNVNDASSFSCLLRDIHHALVDDGEITFYLVDDEPRLSCEYDFELKDCLSDEERQSGDQFDCKILNKITIDDWIKSSEEYFVNEIKSNFMFDYQLNPDGMIEWYKKYECFDENWIKEIN